MQFNASNFKQQVSTIARSLTVQRDNVQEAIEFAVEQSKADSNFTFLDVLMDALRPVRMVRTNTLKKYITAHVTNLKYAKASDGKLRFMKKKKGVPCEYTAFEYAWYEQDNDGEVQPDIDVVARINGLRSQLEKALSGDGDKQVKQGQDSLARQLVQALKDITSAAPAKGEQAAVKHTAKA